MAKITGICAVMIYANDPESLSRWYGSHLGIETKLEQDGCYYGDIEDTVANTTIHFGIYPARAKLSAENHALMLNYRVDNFDEFLEQIQSKGVKIEETEDQSYGRFAYIHDPEGNKIEIFAEPAAQASTGS